MYNVCLKLDVAGLYGYCTLLCMVNLVNPSNAEATVLSSKAQGHNDFGKSSTPCHVGIHRIVLAEGSQMSTHESGFKAFFLFLHNFVIAKLATSNITVNTKAC